VGEAASDPVTRFNLDMVGCGMIALPPSRRCRKEKQWCKLMEDAMSNLSPEGESTCETFVARAMCGGGGVKQC